MLQLQRNVVTQIFVVTMSGLCSLSDRQSGPIDRTPVTPGSDNNRNILKKYEVNYMNLEQGAATSNKEPEKAWPSLHVTENKKDDKLH